MSQPQPLTDPLPPAQPIDPQTIEGKRKHEKTKEKGDYFYRELAYGKFSRTMTLPAGAEADKVKATRKDGVLQITMPAPKALAPKRIQVQAK